MKLETRYRAFYLRRGKFWRRILPKGMVYVKQYPLTILTKEEQIERYGRDWLPTRPGHVFELQLGVPIEEKDENDPGR